MAVMVANSRTRARSGLLVATALTAALLAGCDGGDDPPSRADASVPLALTLGPVVGSLPRKERDNLQVGVSEALTSYVVAGFLGDYPREDFLEVLGSFTDGAARSAAEDLDLLSASGFADAEGVKATRLEAEVVPFAPKGEAAGASVRVSFTFAVDHGDASPAQRVKLEGHLQLTPVQGRWVIFAYDVNRDDLPAGAGTVSP